MEQRISLITLGVADVARARAFYEGLGWQRGGPELEEVAFFQCGGMVLGLWSRVALAAESMRTDSGGWGGITLSHNVRSAEEVDAVIAEAVAAGASIGRLGAPTEWGGYSGVFHDPDGHAWEVAHNPGWPLGEDGTVTLS